MCCFCNISSNIWCHNLSTPMHNSQRHFPDHPEPFKTIWNFPDNPEIFQTNRKLSTPFGNFLDSLGIFQIIQKYFILSGNFPDSPQTFLTIRKLSRLAGNFLAQFQGYAKQISEWQCHDATIVFGPLLLTQYHFCKQLTTTL